MISTVSAAQALPVQSEQSVLIVDDNQIVTRTLAKLLARHGMKPITSSTAAEALQEAEKAPPAAAVVDIHLPDLSGLILTQRLRAILGDRTPIIIVSGDGSREILSSLPDVGATYFFSKPVNARALVEQIRTLLS